jgi:hypothetical protein
VPKTLTVLRRSLMNWGDTRSRPEISVGVRPVSRSSIIILRMSSQTRLRSPPTGIFTMHDYNTTNAKNIGTIGSKNSMNWSYIRCGNTIKRPIGQIWVKRIVAMFRQVDLRAIVPCKLPKNRDLAKLQINIPLQNWPWGVVFVFFITNIRPIRALLTAYCTLGLGEQGVVVLCCRDVPSTWWSNAQGHCESLAATTYRHSEVGSEGYDSSCSRRR